MIKSDIQAFFEPNDADSHVTANDAYALDQSHGNGETI
jgi:hypothetical protein